MTRTSTLLLIFALFAPAVRADSAYRFELTPRLNYHFGGEISSNSNETLPFDVELEDGDGYGVAFDIPLSREFQLELLVDRQITDLVDGGGLFGPDFALAELDLLYAHVGLLVQFGGADVSPFVVVSAGATRLEIDVPGTSAETRISASVGGGVKTFFGPHFGMRFEGRYFWTELDSWEVRCDDRCYDARDYLSQLQASIGLIVAW